MHAVRTIMTMMMVVICPGTPIVKRPCCVDDDAHADVMHTMTAMMLRARTPIMLMALTGRMPTMCAMAMLMLKKRMAVGSEF